MMEVRKTAIVSKEELICMVERKENIIINRDTCKLSMHGLKIIFE